MNKIDIGWLAGIIDGEGCFTLRIHKHKTKNYGIRPRFSPQLIITNTDELIIEKIKRIFDEIGVKYATHRRDRTKLNPNSKIQYDVITMSNGLKSLFPLIKKECCKSNEITVLEKVLKIIEKNKRTGNKNGLPGRQPMSIDTLKKIDALRMELVSLHGRQAKNLIKLKAEDYKNIKER